MNKKGFTIVELLIVIVVIAVLTTITVVAYNGTQNKARNSASKSAQAMVVKKVELYKTLHGEYPSAGEDLSTYRETRLTGGVIVTPGNPDSDATYDIGYADCTVFGVVTGAYVIRNVYTAGSYEDKILGTGC